MLSRFFIHRPIFAAVVSLVIVIGGGITMLSLPISQYPVIEPPTVTVSASYPGANARVVADTVAAPIEQQVNGVEGMIYMSSTAANDGSYTLTVTFETGTDLDMAQVLVQNRVAIAQPKLPEDVKRIGITTKKKSPSFALMVAIMAKGGEYDDVYLANYATLNIKDELSRIPGSGDVLVLGADEYSMRIWLDPEKMKSLDLTTDDITTAIQEQNVQVAAGTIGLPPAPKGQDFQYTVSVLGRLESVRQFENIIVKTGSGGRITRVKDLGRVDLGAKSYNMKAQLNGKPNAMIQVFQLPGANVLDLAKNVKAKMEELSKRFPQGVEYVVCYDASDVVVASIDEIVETLFIAAVLVVLTVFVFLQDWRATLIPAVTIPVSLIGTFAVMGVLGFSINTLTMFGLVLAIGIVVDDAIVVVENTARNIDDSGLSPKDATILAMEEVTGPVIATTLVLLAVFIPTAFMGGITGLLYKQFALTIATRDLLQLHQRPYPFPGFVRAFAQENSGKKGSLVEGLQPEPGQEHKTLFVFRKVRGAQAVVERGCVSWNQRGGLFGHDHHPHRFCAPGGPGLPDGQRPAAGRRLPAAHLRRDPEGQQDRGEHAGSEILHRAHRIFHHQRHQRLQHGRGGGGLQALE